MDIQYPGANLEVKSLIDRLGRGRAADPADLSTPCLGKSTTAKTTLLFFAPISIVFAVFLHTSET